MYQYIKFYFLYRKRRQDTKSEDAIGLEPMETPMSERNTNVYFEDTDGKTFIYFSNMVHDLKFFVNNLAYLLVPIYQLRVDGIYLHFISLFERVDKMKQ